MLRVAKVIKMVFERSCKMKKNALKTVIIACVVLLIAAGPALAAKGKQERKGPQHNIAARKQAYHGQRGVQGCDSTAARLMNQKGPQRGQGGPLQMYRGQRGSGSRFQRMYRGQKGPGSRFQQMNRSQKGQGGPRQMHRGQKGQGGSLQMHHGQRGQSRSLQMKRGQRKPN